MEVSGVVVVKPDDRRVVVVVQTGLPGLGYDVEYRMFQRLSAATGKWFTYRTTARRVVRRG